MALISLSAIAQKTVEWEKYFDELYASNDENAEAKEEIFDVLSDLSEHPINLNTAQREDLERIPFLTEAQIEELQAYIYQYHGIREFGIRKGLKKLVISSKIRIFIGENQ